MFDTVDCINTFQNIFDRIIHRIFTGFDRQTLVSHILKCGNLSYDILLCQLLSCNMFILAVIWTIDTSIHTIIGQIQRRK